MIEMSDIKEWESFMDSPIPIILQAGADWSVESQKWKQMLLEEAVNHNGKVQYVYFDIQKFPQLAGALSIKTIPQTFMIFKGGLVDKIDGVPDDDPESNQELWMTLQQVRDFFEKAGDLDEKDLMFSDASSGEGLKVEKTLEVTEGETVPRGARVKVHYTGKLTNGKVFDSSVPRGKPFEFVLGVGQVIKGWDEGFLQLRKGEKAILTCPPEYAYGAREISGVIPANSTLIFEVELIDFK